MASEVHKISLFSDDYVEKMNRYTSVQSLVLELTSYSTWSDHSILRMLAGPCEKAIRLLDSFDSRLDPFQPIMFYDTPSYLLSNMVPSDESACTLLAVKLANFPDHPSLQVVHDTQSLLMDKCGITHHCFRLLAAKHNPTIIYWIIPKCVADIFSTVSLESTGYLNEKGIIKVLIYWQPEVMFDAMTEHHSVFEVVDKMVSKIIMNVKRQYKM